MMTWLVFGRYGNRFGMHALSVWSGILLASVAISRPVIGRTHLVPEEYSTIQDGIDACETGDTVSVAPGTYSGTRNREISFRGRDVVLRGRAGQNVTIIDCEYLGTGLLFEDYETQDARVDGFTIMRGYGPRGGAVYCNGASPTFANCVFISNRADTGGALFLATSSACFRSCTIAGNTVYAIGGGGGVRVVTGDLLFDNCVVSGNVGYRGGGFLIEGANVMFKSCTLASNMSNHEGGAIFNLSGAIACERSVVWGNCAAEEGREVYSRTSVTFACSAVDSAGVDGADVLYVGENVFDDPRFCDADSCDVASVGGDYSIRSDSPCMPGGNACGVLIGALGMGCPAPEGACCLPGGECVLEIESLCTEKGGEYVGDWTACVPDPCAATCVPLRTWGSIKRAFR